MNTKFQVIHKESGKIYWFDLMWGESGNGQKGATWVLPIGEELKKSGNMSMTDNRIPIDLRDCEIKPYRFCCVIGCNNAAEWEVWSSPGNSTDACTSHVGELLSDADEHRIFSIKK